MPQKDWNSTMLRSITSDGHSVLDSLILRDNLQHVYSGGFSSSKHRLSTNSSSCLLHLSLLFTSKELQVKLRVRRNSGSSILPEGRQSIHDFLLDKSSSEVEQSPKIVVNWYLNMWNFQIRWTSQLEIEHFVRIKYVKANHSSALRAILGSWPVGLLSAPPLSHPTAMWSGGQQSQPVPSEQESQFIYMHLIAPLYLSCLECLKQSLWQSVWQNYKLSYLIS